MTTFQHVLVPVDLTERSRHTALHADDIARACGARLSLIHVQPLYPTETGSLPVDRDREALLRALSDLADELRPRRPVAWGLLDGDPASEILQYAAQRSVDLIVMGSHRRSAIERILSESVTERVCAEAAASVLVVPTAVEEARRPPVDPAEIVCAVDFSETSLDTVHVAVALARATKTHVTLLHVVEPPLSKQAAASADRLAELVSGVDGGVDVRVALGRAPVQIANTVKSHRAAIVIVGAHASRLLGRARLGPTPLWLLRHAPCPILLARKSVSRISPDLERSEPACAGRA